MGVIQSPTCSPPLKSPTPTKMKKLMLDKKTPPSVSSFINRLGKTMKRPKMKIQPATCRNSAEKADWIERH